MLVLELDVSGSELEFALGDEGDLLGREAKSDLVGALERGSAKIRKGCLLAIFAAGPGLSKLVG